MGELYFLMIAAGLGMKVLRPFGQTGVYDVGVERSGRLQRVQVKSTIYKRRQDEYSLNVMGPQRKMYAPGTVDYFAVLLIPIDLWFIIPYEVIGAKNCTLHLRPRGGSSFTGSIGRRGSCCGAYAARKFGTTILAMEILAMKWRAGILILISTDNVEIRWGT